MANKPTLPLGYSDPKREQEVIDWLTDTTDTRKWAANIRKRPIEDLSEDIRVFRDAVETMQGSLTALRDLGLGAKLYVAKAEQLLSKWESFFASDKTLKPVVRRALGRVIRLMRQEVQRDARSGAQRLRGTIETKIAQKIADTVKAIPLMSSLDKLMAIMGKETISSRINRRLGTLLGKTGFGRQAMAGAGMRGGLTTLDLEQAQEESAKQQATRTAYFGGVKPFWRAEKQRRMEQEKAATAQAQAMAGASQPSLFGMIPVKESVPSPTSPRRAGTTRTSGGGLTGDNTVVEALFMVYDVLDKKIYHALYEIYSFMVDESADRKRDAVAAATNQQLAAEAATTPERAAALSALPEPASTATKTRGGGLLSRLFSRRQRTPKTPGRTTGPDTLGGMAGQNIGQFIGYLGGGILQGLAAGLKAVAQAGPEVIEGAAILGGAIGIMLIELAGAAKIISLFGGADAIRELMEGLAKGFEAFSTAKIDAGRLALIGAALTPLGIGLAAIAPGFAALAAVSALTLPLIAKSLEQIGKVDGANLINVGKGLTRIAAGITAISAAASLDWLTKIFSFGLASPVRLITQFEQLDAIKLDAVGEAMMKLGVGLEKVVGATKSLSDLTPQEQQAIVDFIKSTQSARRSTTPQTTPAGPNQPSQTPSPDVTPSNFNSSTNTPPAVKPGAGTALPETLDAAKSINSVVRVGQFTSFADQYHQLNAPKSLHNQGLAMDFSVTERPDVAYAKLNQLRSDAGLSPKEMYIQNEYSNPSPGSTGGHMHVQFSSPAAAAKFASYANSLQSTAPAPVAQPAPSTSPTTAPTNASSGVLANLGASPVTSRAAGPIQTGTAQLASMVSSAPVIIAPQVIAALAGRSAGPAMMPIPIPIAPRNTDDTLRALMAVNQF